MQIVLNIIYVLITAFCFGLVLVIFNRLFDVIFNRLFEYNMECEVSSDISHIKIENKTEKANVDYDIKGHTTNITNITLNDSVWVGDNKQ
jgi:hypothetical protein